MNNPFSRLSRAAIAFTLTLGTIFFLAPPAGATPPSIPSPAEAETMLAELTVAPEGSLSGYSRGEFPHWTTVSGTCNTREWVLRRDGVGVQSGPDGNPTSGSWSSPYDGESWSRASDLDIDHIVSVPAIAEWQGCPGRVVGSIAVTRSVDQV